jgi:hypothetical protein
MVIQKKILLYASIYSVIIFLFQFLFFGTFNNYIIKVMIVALSLSLVTWIFRGKNI